MKDREVVYIGIDVSKETLDIDAGKFGIQKIANAPTQIRRILVKYACEVEASRPVHVCFESTGPYTAALMAECQTMGMAYSILNPYKVAYFARALAHAKTDSIDASVIRRFAEQTRPAPVSASNQTIAELNKLILARETLVKNSVATRAVLDTLTSPVAAKPMKRFVAALERQIVQYDQLIAESVKADVEVSDLVGALSEVMGIGVLTAVKVLVWMPEIGRLGRGKVAALAGLAPRTRQSGGWQGKAYIGGGRKAVRNALFMPATVAIRYNPEMKAFHKRLMAAGKPYKVALTAVMRRLICHLDRVAGRYYAEHKKETPS
jgi:transposase